MIGNLISLLFAINVDRWAKAHAMLREVRESIVILVEEVTRKLQPQGNESHVYLLWTNAPSGR